MGPIIGASVIVTIDYKRLPRLFYFSLGALCSLLLASLASEHRLNSLSSQHSQHYGSALAQMAAQQAVDATLNHDLVSLQVILEDVAANPGVILATIHDVENNLLVQAGDASRARKADVQLSAHTAPINLHDSVAGYVTATLATGNDGQSAVQTSIAVVALLLALIAGLSLYDYRDRLFLWKDPVMRPSKTADTEEETDEDDQRVEEAATASAYGRIQVANLAALRQQLSAAVFETVIQRLDQLVSDVLALYNGQLLSKPSPANRQGGYLVRFECQDSCSEAVFRATCSCYLVIQLAADLTPFPLELGAELTLGPMDEETSPAFAEIAWTGLLIERQAADDPLLQRRLVVSATPEQPDKCKLMGFQQPFSSLLQKQCTQLKQLPR